MSQGDEKADWWSALKFTASEKLPTVKKHYINFITENDPWWLNTIYDDDDGATLATVIDRQKILSAMKANGAFYDALGKVYDERKGTHNAYKPLVNRGDIKPDWERPEDLGIDGNDKSPARKEKMKAYLTEYAPELLDKKIKVAGSGNTTIRLAIEKQKDGERTMTPADTVYNKIREAYFEWPIAPGADKKEVYNDDLLARKALIKTFLNRTGEAGRRTLAEEMAIGEGGAKETVESVLRLSHHDGSDGWYDDGVADLDDGTIYYYIRTKYRENHQNVESEKNNTNDNAPKTSPSVPPTGDGGNDDTTAASSTGSGSSDANQPQVLIPPWPISDDGAGSIKSVKQKDTRIDKVEKFLGSSEVGRAVLDETIDSGTTTVDGSADLAKVSFILGDGKVSKSRYSEYVSWTLRSEQQSPYGNIKNRYNLRRNAAIAILTSWSIGSDIGTAVGRRAAITKFLSENNSDLYDNGIVGYQGNDVNVRDLLESKAYTAESLWDPESGVLYRLLENAYNGESFNDDDIKPKEASGDDDKKSTSPVSTGGDDATTSGEDEFTSLGEDDSSDSEEDEKSVVASQAREIEKQRAVIDGQAQQANKSEVLEKQLVAKIAEATGDPNAGRLAEEAAQQVAQRVTTLEVELAAERATNEELRRERQRSAVELDEARREAARVRATMEETVREARGELRGTELVRDELAAARRERDEARAEAGRLSGVATQLLTLQSTNTILDEQRAAAVTEATRLGEDLRVQTNLVGEKTREAETLAIEKAALAGQLQQLQIEMVSLRNGGGDIDATLERQDATISALNTQMDELRREKDARVPRDEFEALEAREAEARRELLQAISEKFLLEAQLVGVPELRVEVVELMKRPTSEELANVVDENTELSKETERVTQQREDALARVASAESESTRLGDELAQATQRNVVLVTRAERGERERDEARTSLTAARVQLQRLIDDSSSSSTVVNTGDLLDQVKQSEMERLRLDVERLEQENAALGLEKERLEAIPLWRLSGKKGNDIVRSNRKSIAGVERLVAMQRDDLNYIRTHWGFYRLLRIGDGGRGGANAGNTISFMTFIDDHPELIAQPGEVVNQQGRFYYRLADFNFVEALRGEGGGGGGGAGRGGAALLDIDHRVDATQSHALTLGDYAMQSHLDALLMPSVDLLPVSSSTPLSMGAPRSLPPLGNHRFSVVFRDAADRPVLGFVAQQLESYRLFKQEKGAAMDHIVLIDMAQHWPQLRYTTSTGMGHAVFKSRGSVQVRHEAGAGGRWERVYAFTVAAPHVVDLKYAYGQESVVPLGDDGEMLVSYVTPTYAALKRLVLPYRPSPLDGEPGEGVLIVGRKGDKKKKKKEKEPVNDDFLEEPIQGNAEPPVLPKTGGKKTVVIHFSSTVPIDTAIVELRYSVFNFLRTAMNEFRWVRDDSDPVVYVPPDAMRLFVNMGPVKPADGQAGTAYLDFMRYRNQVKRPIVIVLETRDAPLWTASIEQYNQRLEYDTASQEVVTSPDDSIVINLRTLLGDLGDNGKPMGWVPPVNDDVVGVSTRAVKPNKQTILLVPSDGIVARQEDGRLSYIELTEKLDFWSQSSNVQWRMLRGINVTSLERDNARRVFLAELPERASLTTSLEDGLTGLGDFKSYVATVEKPIVMALNESDQLASLGPDNNEFIKQILIDADGKVIDDDQVFSNNKVNWFMARLTDPDNSAGRRKRAESTSESSSTTTTTSSFFNFSSSDVANATGERTASSDIYEIVMDEYATPLPRSDVGSGVINISAIAFDDDDDGVFDAIGQW